MISEPVFSVGAAFSTGPASLVAPDVASPKGVATGTVSAPSASVPRIVSLIASATEWVCALGGRDRLVGRSHECDFPPSVLDLPACSSAKFDVHGNSREIDDRVKQVLRDATSVYNVDTALLEQLQPTLIITQAQCEVCAVSLKDVEAAVCALVSSRPQVISLEPNSLADIWADGLCVAEAMGMAEAGRALIAGLQARLEQLQQRCRLLSRPQQRVACIEWLEPLMAGGNWVPELVELVGAENLFGTAGRHSPWMTWDELRTADPDVIIALPCGYDLPKTRSEMHWLTDRPDWRKLAAVRQGRVYVTDGNQYFNRPGPRVVESAEILAEILYVGEFNWQHHKTGWQPFPG